MKIRANIIGPIYEVKHVYGKPQPVRRMNEECKKSLLLAISVEETTEVAANYIQERIFREICDNHTGTHMVKLSDCKWAQEEMKSWWDGYTYKDCLLVPKDFDNLAEQKETLLNVTRKIIRDLKRELKDSPISVLGYQL